MTTNRFVLKEVMLRVKETQYKEHLSESEESASSDPEAVTSKSRRKRLILENVLCTKIHNTLVMTFGRRHNIGMNEGDILMDKIALKVRNIVRKLFRYRENYTVKICLFFGEELDYRDHHLVTEMYNDADQMSTYTGEHILCRVALYWRILD